MSTTRTYQIGGQRIVAPSAIEAFWAVYPSAYVVDIARSGWSGFEAHARRDDSAGEPFLVQFVEIDTESKTRVPRRRSRKSR